MQFSATTIVLAMAYLAGIGAGAAIPEASSLHQLIARKSHVHCACQSATNGEIDATATALVAASNSWRWHLENFPQEIGSGAHYAGYYIVANSGKIDGDAFYGQCKIANAADSTCF